MYVFLPSNPYPIYQRKDLPKIEGAVWLPKRHPKQQSLDVDWQAISQLIFLSREQVMTATLTENQNLNLSLISQGTALFFR